MIREVASCVLLTCCLFVPHLTAPFFSLLLYYASSNIVSPPSFFFFFFFGRACETRLVSESAKTPFPPSLEGLHQRFAQCSATPGRERCPAGIFSPFQALLFIPEIKYFQKWWGWGVAGGGKDLFWVLFPNHVLLADVLSSATLVASLMVRDFRLYQSSPSLLRLPKRCVEDTAGELFSKKHLCLKS